MASRLIGSDFREDVEAFPCALNRHVERCLKVTKWLIIAAICPSMRDGMKQKISGKFSGGSENVIKLFEFQKKCLRATMQL